MLGSVNLFCSDREELNDHFQWHAFGFWNFEEHKHPSYAAHNCVQTKNTAKAYRIQHNWEWIGDNDVTYPKGKSTYGNAKTTNSSWEDLSTKYIRNWPKSHDKGTKIDNNANGWDRRICSVAQIHKAP